MSLSAATPDAIAEAARSLRAGGLVAFPTETVYGLGADATNETAVARIFAAKGRPSFNPLIIHLPEARLAWRYGQITPLAEILSAAFWPGPLTLVVPRRASDGIADLALAGLDTIALRVPAHPLALALLRATDRPLAAPSANVSGRISPTRAEDVAREFGGAVHVLDGGPARVGLESTIVDVTGSQAVLLRPGGVTRAELDAVLDAARATVRGARLVDPAVRSSAAGETAPTAPGQLVSHYAPRARVRLDAHDVGADEALLAFGPPLAHTGALYNLSPTGDLIEAAAHLFAALRALDASGAATIAVMPIPTHGLGEAIIDRLTRAAAPRDR